MLINTANLKFEDQLTSSGFTGVSSEIFNGAQLTSNYIDINAGLLYNGSTSDRNNFYFGISMYHINRPKQQFTGADYILNPRTTFHGGRLFSTRSQQHASFEWIIHDTGWGFRDHVRWCYTTYRQSDAPKPSSFYVGSWVRFNDAIIPYLGLEFDDFRLGLTYDYNTSALKTASQNRGGIEISLIYVRRPSTDRPVNCPKF